MPRYNELLVDSRDTREKLLHGKKIISVDSVPSEANRVFRAWFADLKTSERKVLIESDKEGLTEFFKTLFIFSFFGGFAGCTKMTLHHVML